MSEMIASYIGKMSPGFFMVQTAVILLLFIFGFMVNSCLLRGKMCLLEVLLAFPVGISVYSLAAFLILVTGLPFNRVSITGICALVAVACTVAMGRIGESSYLGGLSGKNLVVYSITVLCIAVISTSGILSISLSNDSLYYYWMYPRALVSYGFLRPQFDVFLTDVGQTSATLNTLPFMYGFNEGFGIQTFLGINTLLIAVYAMYHKAKEKLDNKKAVVTTVILSFLLITTQPFLIMLKWMMSNGYFMCFMFITVYAGYVFDGMRDPAERGEGMRGRMMILSILMLQMSMLRMEGIMVALILTVCFMSLKFKNTELFFAFSLPAFICALAYAYRVFVICKVDAPYTFLTPKKALIQLAAILAVSIYLLVFRGRRYDPAGSHIRLVLPLVLVGANIVLFFTNKTLFVENLLAFSRNISNRSGWGLFPMYMIACYVLVFILYFRKKKDEEFMNFWDMCFICYLLAALAVCFAREDALRESIGDSGNRVLMQVTLLAFYAGTYHLIELVDVKGDTLAQS